MKPATRARHCPICAGVPQFLDRFAFGRKPNLPDHITFDYCRSCNFIFAENLEADAYYRYYQTVQNDAGHIVVSDKSTSLPQLQAARIRTRLGKDFCGSILDFGCGQARLLQLLTREYPKASLYGHDVSNFVEPDSGIQFLPSIEDRALCFDLIIVSHVLEHLVGFSIIGVLAGLLAPGGLMYIEVPNPHEYSDCSRREFMYYFDRLHINHFSQTAMSRLLSQFELGIDSSGTHRFLYRDGVYPAHYCFATRADMQHQPSGFWIEGALDKEFEDYRALEAERSATLREKLLHHSATVGILAYGAGDNFHRARWPGGPLFKVPLLGVLDRNADSLAANEGFIYMKPGRALAEYPNAVVAVTISQLTYQFISDVRAENPDRTIYCV